MTAVKDHLTASGIETCNISVGDTPTCSVVDNFVGVDEIRPGNFVFYDLMQEKLGACTEDEIAVAVACPVIGKYKERNQIAVYGGLVHLSSAFILDGDDRKIYGCATSLHDGTFGPINREAPVIGLSQEHGAIQAGKNLWDGIEIGNLILLFPIHSCLTCDLHGRYTTTKGDAVSRL
jgi:D-serine deaminase-like pyridoxal phosphate-dependent protein